MRPTATRPKPTTDSTEVMIPALRAALILEANAVEFLEKLVKFPVKFPVKPPVKRVGAAPVANLR